MIQLSEHAINVINNFNLIGMWLAVLVCCRNFSVCLHQYQRTRGKIHLVNLAQVSVFLVHRILYGVIPLFEIQTCAYFPLLVSLWHITYILFYVVMFMRLIILELDKYSRWIKTIGVLLITLRAADWPYELAFHSITEKMMDQVPQSGSQCWAEWGAGVIILNFVGDALANLFLSGMFVRRLFIHIQMSKSLMSHQNKVIESIARKSLICLAFTFVVNLAMNLLKVTMFLGDHSDAFTVYFEIIESTLLVEALRNDGVKGKGQYNAFCESCQKEVSNGNDRAPNNDENLHSQMLVRSFHMGVERDRYNSTYTEDTYHDHPMQRVSSMEPALFFDAKSPTLFSHSARFGNLQLRIPSPITDEPLPSPPSRNSLAKDEFIMEPPPPERMLTPRGSSSILTSKVNLHDSNASSPDRSPYWKPID